MNWFVLYVNSRAEKKVAERLAHKGFEVFCPMKIELRQWSDRKKQVEVPYFRSYVFVRMEKTSRLKVLETPGVVNFVYWLKEPAIIRTKEMDQIIHFFESNKQNEILETSIEEGQEVNVIDGALKDLKGIVIKKNKHQVILEMRSLGLAFKVQLRKESVQRVE